MYIKSVESSARTWLAGREEAAGEAGAIAMPMPRAVCRYHIWLLPAAAVPVQQPFPGGGEPHVVAIADEPRRSDSAPGTRRIASRSV
jgi:hypothetical protein